METYICKQCNKPFIPKESNRITFCSRECSFAYRREHAKPKTKLMPKQNIYICKSCGKQFVHNRYRSYCSEECRKEISKSITLKYDMSKRPTKTFTCKECGKEFTTNYGDKRKSYCSIECMDKAQKREDHVKNRIKSKDKFVSHINFNEIFIRDKGICKICGEPIGMSLKAPHPMSVTIGHIIPLSKGGTHEINNVQLAHRRCNSIKGNSI